MSDELKAAAARALGGRSPLRLTFDELIAANLARVQRWHPEKGLADWSPLEWAGAMAGEAGEACNAAKKLKRIDIGTANINHEPGRSLTDRERACKQIAKEAADTVVYAVLLCAAVGEDLGASVVEVFNRKSEEYGFPERIGGADDLEAVIGTLPNQETDQARVGPSVPCVAPTGSTADRPMGEVTAAYRERPIELLRQTLSMLCHYVWHKETRPGEHMWSIPVDKERDFDCILSDAINELKARRAVGEPWIAARPHPEIARECDQCGWKASSGWPSERCGSNPFGSCDGTVAAAGGIVPPADKGTT